MNIYKEIFLDCETNNKSDNKIIELSSSTNSNINAAKNKNLNNSFQNKPEKKGFTYSFDYFIVNW
jgi:hypothetical protein